MSEVDYTILTVRAGALTQKRLAESIEVIERMGTPVLGFVLIGALGRSREQQQYYHYYTDS